MRGGDGWVVFTQKVAFGLLGIQRGWYFLASFLIYSFSWAGSLLLLRLLLQFRGVGAPL